MNYKEYLLKQFDLTEGMRMNYYEEILKTGDFIALSEGKVSFAEVDEELERRRSIRHEEYLDMVQEAREEPEVYADSEQPRDYTKAYWRIRGSRRARRKSLLHLQ